jgi:hypothetical protein
MTDVRAHEGANPSLYSALKRRVVNLKTSPLIHVFRDTVTIGLLHTKRNREHVTPAEAA